MQEAALKSEKKVSFSPIARFKRVRHFRSFTEEDHDAIWYSPLQLRAVVDECITTCQMMMAGEVVLEEDGYCTRGLEYKTACSFNFRRINKTRAIQIVLNECETQKNLLVHKPDFLAILYSKATKDARRMAHLMALRDQEEASQIHAPPSLTRDKNRDHQRAPSSSSVPTSPVSDSEKSLSSFGHSYHC